jgi:peptide deformylase
MQGFLRRSLQGKNPVSELKIVKYPHPALRFPSKPLPAIDKTVRIMAGTMLELMYAARGLGLAANQVNWPFQMFVMNPQADATKKEEERILINPVVIERKGTIEGDEGCLSFPDLYQRVRRAKTVKVHAYDLEGKLIEIVTSEVDPERAELTSRLLQHEIDHLHGDLYIDKFGTLARLAARSELRKFERDYHKGQDKGEIPSDAEIERRLKEMSETNSTPIPIL